MTALHAQPALQQFAQPAIILLQAALLNVQRGTAWRVGSGLDNAMGKLSNLANGRTVGSFLQRIHLSNLLLLHCSGTLTILLRCGQLLVQLVLSRVLAWARRRG